MICVIVGARPVGIPELLASSLSRQPVVPAPDEIDTVAISQADKVFQAIDPVQIMRRLCDIPSLCLVSALPLQSSLDPFALLPLQVRTARCHRCGCRLAPLRAAPQNTLSLPHPSCLA